MARVMAGVRRAATRATAARPIRRFREVPVLERVLKEVLRLHPPLVILMRGVLQRLHGRGRDDPAGKLVAISPAVSHRIPELFRDPTRFDPSRYDPGREEDATPFAGSRSAAAPPLLGAAFAIMQLKAITMSLLRASRSSSSTRRELRPGLHEDGRAAAQPCRVATGVADGATPMTARRGNGRGGTRAVRVRVDPALPGPRRLRVGGARVFPLNARRRPSTCCSRRARGAPRALGARREALPHPRPLDRGRLTRGDDMPAFPRSEMEEMMRRWLTPTRTPRPPATGAARRLLHEDAEYTWNLGPNEDFVARGREQIRDWVMGTRWRASTAGSTRTTRPHRRPARRGVALWRPVAAADARGRPRTRDQAWAVVVPLRRQLRMSWQRYFCDFSERDGLLHGVIKFASSARPCQKAGSSG
jgi:hypothetical protein